MLHKPSISIIIPVLNEIKIIDNLVSRFKILPQNILEVIAVDGGSKDGTLEAISKSKNLKVVESEKGRAKQMNAGAAVAKGDIFYFMHVDTVLPKDFDKEIIKHFKSGYLAGCFRMKFDSDHLLLQVSQWFTRLNFSLCRGGDQSLYINKSLFWELGGYNEDFMIYEDNDLTNRIYKKTTFNVMPNYVITSARKYEEIGFWKLQYHFARVHLLKLLGAKPNQLYNYYKKNIA